MKKRRLVAAAIVTVLLPHWRASGADFDGEASRLSKRPAERFYIHRDVRSAVDACEAGRSFEIMGDENSDFDPAIGCSTRANLAAMVSRRRDLVRGQGARYHDAERASDVVGQYRAGKVPPATEQANHATDQVNRVR